MNFCKDCKYIQAHLGLNYAKCVHPKFGIRRADPVSGEIRYWYCITLREFDLRVDQSCPHFEAKTGVPVEPRKPKWRDVLARLKVW